MKAPRLILIGMVRVYQWTLSPIKNALLGPVARCRFSPTCSCYATEALREHGAIGGSRLVFKRVIRCHPWGGAGYDPVPQKAK